MTILEALVLGIIQGLTEFLPISSSGHLELGAYFLGTQSDSNLLFAIIVHGATALSTIVVFRKDIAHLVTDFLRFRNNDGTRYILKLAVSMIPVGIVGVFFEDEIGAFFGGNIRFVAYMLIVTGALLLFTKYRKPATGDVSFAKAIVIGLAQTIAILPGISRSGATISTALLLGVSKDQATRFSFLMVLAPILGAMLLKVKNLIGHPQLATGMSTMTIIVGFLAAFLSGLLACTWMIHIVRKGNLVYFAIYCFVVATGVLLLTSI